MVQVAIGILFMVIIFSSIGLLYFYNRIINKKIAVEDIIESIFLQYKRKNDLITEYGDLISSKEMQGLERLNEFVRGQYSFTNVRIIEEVVKFPLKISDDSDKLFIKKGNQQWDNDKELMDILYKLNSINENINELYQMYDHEAINYNDFLLKFPNNVLRVILGIRSLPYSSK